MQVQCRVPSSKEWCSLTCAYLDIKLKVLFTLEPDIIKPAHSKCHHQSSGGYTQHLAEHLLINCTH